MVRATAKLSTVASSTATSAVDAQRRVDRPQEAQALGARVQDQRGPARRPSRRSAAGRGAAAAAARGRRSRRRPDATLWRCRWPRSSCERRPRRRRQRGRKDLAVQPNATSLPVIALQLRRPAASSSRKPTLSVPRIFGRGQADRDRHRDDLQDAVAAAGSRLQAFAARERVRDRRLAGAIAGRRASRRRGQHVAACVLVTSSRLGVELLPDSRRRCPARSAGSLVSIAALSFGRSAISRAIDDVACGALRAAAASTSGPRRDDLALQLGLGLARRRASDHEIATPIASTASSALARKMRLRSDEKSVIAA